MGSAEEKVLWRGVGGNGFRVLGFSSCSGGSECMCMCLCMYMGVVWMMDGDVISVTACQAIANIVKTFLGHVGLDKVRFLAISVFSCILDFLLDAILS